MEESERYYDALGRLWIAGCSMSQMAKLFDKTEEQIREDTDRLRAQWLRGRTNT